MEKLGFMLFTLGITLWLSEVIATIISKPFIGFLPKSNKAYIKFPLFLVLFIFFFFLIILSISENNSIYLNIKYSTFFACLVIAYFSSNAIVELLRRKTILKLLQKEMIRFTIIVLLYISFLWSLVKILF